MDLDWENGRFSGDGRFGQKLDKLGVLDVLDEMDDSGVLDGLDVLDKMDDSGVLDILDVLDEMDVLDVLDEIMGDADPGPDSGPVLDLDKGEPGLEAGPRREKVLDWENGRFWDKLDVLDKMDENWELGGTG